LTASALKNMPPNALSALTISTSTQKWQEMTALYMDTDETNRYQIFTTPVEGGDPVQITSAPEGISGYTISPDNTAVIYAANQGALESSIWLWDLDSGEHRSILDCAPDFCKAPVWPPSGDKLIYERLQNPTDPNALGISSIWWLVLETGETAPVFQDANFPAFYPNWSPSGEWLTYSSINPNQIRLYHQQSGDSLEIALEGNPQAIWHPSKNIILFTEYVDINDQSMNKLKLFDLDTRETRLVSKSDTLDEVLPNWTNDGEKIIVIRREWIEGIAEIGDQIWLLNPETGAEEQITFGEEIIHGRATMSPDGKALLFHIYNLTSEGNPTEIQALELKTGEITIIASPGTNPRWIP
jgi:Tol biopolymer transport system component